VADNLSDQNTKDRKLKSNGKLYEVIRDSRSELGPAIQKASRGNHLPTLRFILYRFLAQAQKIREQLEVDFGAGFWGQATAAVKHNGLAAAYLALFRNLVHSEREDSILVLQRLRARGLGYRLPDGSPSRHRPGDHGVENLLDAVFVAAELIRRSRELPQIAVTSNKPTNGVKIVIAENVAGLVVQLKGDNVSPQRVVIRNTAAALLLALRSDDYQKQIDERKPTKIINAFLAEAIHVKVPPNDAEGKKLDASLRQHIHKLNKLLESKFSSVLQGRYIIHDGPRRTAEPGTEDNPKGLSRRWYQLRSDISWVNHTTTPFRQREFTNSERLTYYAVTKKFELGELIELNEQEDGVASAKAGLVIPV
jgi:hypothetical protein